MINNIHTLRGIAALMVVMHHCLDILYRNGAISVYPPHGMFGVDIFFVISGFIIVAATKADLPARTFFIKRVFRVFPIYWISTIAVFMMLVLLSYFVSSDNNPTALDLFRSLFFIPYEKINGSIMPILFVGWTLQYELLFYSIFAIGILARKHIHPAGFTTLAIVAIVALGYFVGQNQLILWFYSRPIIITFIGGLFLSYLWQNRSKLEHSVRAYHALALLFPGLILILISSDHNPLVAGLGATLIVASALLLEHLGKVFANSVTKFFGDISFSLYLIHPIIFYGVESVTLRIAPTSSALSFYAGLSIAFVITCALSWVSFRTVELPISKFSRRFTQIAKSQ